MLMLKVDRNSPVPVFKQITDTVVRLVDGGALGAGDRLPPSRVLARTAGVHRSTVTRAYQELWALGYLESRPGSYSTIRRRSRRVTEHEPLPASTIDWTAAATPATREAREATNRLARERLDHPPSGVVDMSRLTGDPDLESGLYEAHLRRVHKAYRKRMSTMLRTLRDHLPARGVEWTEPTGGYTLWLEVNGNSRNERSLHDQFLRDGVKVSCGSPFYPRPSAKPHFRLSIACLDEAQIREGCQRLGRSLSSQLET